MGTATKGRPIRIWFGDYLFRDSFRDVREDFRLIGDRLGFIVCTSKEEPDAICLVNFFFRDLITLFTVRKLRRTKLRMHLITEPTVTLPILESRFWSRLQLTRIVLGGSCNQILIEKPHACVQGPPQGKRLKRAALVNANKFSWVRGEQYTLRRQVVSRLAMLDTYGAGWHQPTWRLFSINVVEALRAAIRPLRFYLGGRAMTVKPQHYMGTVNDKILTLSNYKVCLVIENSQELFTEKLVDAWMARCIPVYVGPNLSCRGIPDFLYLAAEPNLTSIEATIEVAMSMDLRLYHQHLDKWLASKKFKKAWGLESAWELALSPVLQAPNLAAMAIDAEA